MDAFRIVMLTIIGVWSKIARIKIRKSSFAGIAYTAGGLWVLFVVIALHAHRSIDTKKPPSFAPRRTKDGICLDRLRIRL